MYNFEKRLQIDKEYRQYIRNELACYLEIPIEQRKDFANSVVFQIHHIICEIDNGVYNNIDDAMRAFVECFRWRYYTLTNESGQRWEESLKKLFQEFIYEWVVRIHPSNEFFIKNKIIKNTNRVFL